MCDLFGKSQEGHRISKGTIYEYLSSVDEVCRAMNLHFNILGLLLCVHTKVPLIGVSATGITRAESACT